MKSVKKTTFLFILFLLLYSCTKDVPEIKPDFENNPNFIQPLGVGFYWDYVDSTFYDDSWFPARIDTVRLKITGKMKYNFNGDEIELYYWNWYNNYEQKYQSEKYLCNNDENGFYFFGGITDNGIYVLEKSMTLKYPLTLNDNWNESRFSIGTNNEGSYIYILGTSTSICDSVGELFQTGLGKIKCYRIKNYYQSGSDTIENYLYYAKNIGYVGLVNKKRGKIVFKKSLLSYNFSSSSVEKKLFAITNEISDSSRRVFHNPYE